MPFKIRLTDSITLKKFVILKPEVEVEFIGTVSDDVALQNTQDLLDKTVKFQLTIIVNRMSKKDMQETLRDASIDPRFRELVEARIQSQYKNLYYK